MNFEDLLDTELEGISGGDVPRSRRAETRGMSEMISILWSGGWDSTFRLLELSQVEGLSIRPIYIRDHGRARHGA